MVLQDEIDQKSSEIQTDSYPMSIGELINLYRDEEIDIHPEFQRVFRWKDSQKSRFIESILLGIPIPPIFVAQGKGGVWDVIDGVQRLSTIYEFVGIYKDEDKKELPPSTMQGTRFLPSLEGKVWQDDENEENAFTSEQRINFKRAKIDIQIIKKTSDVNTKYELFQRINTGGSQLSPQEMRNCLMIMTKKSFYYWLESLANNEAFVHSTSLSERLIEEQYPLEIITRFVVYRHVDVDTISGNEDMTDYLTDQILKIIESKQLNLEMEKQIFIDTFTYLDGLLSEDSFKKYNDAKGKFEGPFLISAFEAIIVGLSENIDQIRHWDSQTVERKIQEIYSSQAFLDATAKGTRAIKRLKKLITNSRSVFSHDD